jgi:hypothetical protein
MIARNGGWTSLAFLIYWRRIDEIVAKGTVTTYKKQELDQVRKFLDEYRKREGLSMALVDAAAAGLGSVLDDFLPDF